MKRAGFFYLLLHSISCDITLHIISTKFHYMLVKKNEKGKKHLGAIPERVLTSHTPKRVSGPLGPRHPWRTLLCDFLSVGRMSHFSPKFIPPKPFLLTFQMPFLPFSLHSFSFPGNCTSSKSTFSPTVLWM